MKRERGEEGGYDKRLRYALLEFEVSIAFNGSLVVWQYRLQLSILGLMSTPVMHNPQ